MAAIITLTTDMGLADAYVAAIKGVILGINPEAKLVDISHNIAAQNIQQAAFVLSAAHEFFPRKTIHLVVVDPGVGTERRAIILRTPLADFVAPDNGVLSYVIEQDTVNNTSLDQTAPIQTELAPHVEAYAINNPKFWRSPVSNTFHGRDIFAPIAALLSLGFPPTDFGEAINSITMLPVPHPHQPQDNLIVGQILHIDGFGNLITNIKQHHLPKIKQPLTIKVGNHTIQGLSTSYAAGRGLIALIGSNGYLEIALKGGMASAILDSRVGSEVQIKVTTRKDKPAQ